MIFENLDASFTKFLQFCVQKKPSLDLIMVLQYPHRMDLVQHNAIP
jgi:hypothetical protein